MENRVQIVPKVLRRQQEHVKTIKESCVDVEETIQIISSLGVHFSNVERLTVQQRLTRVLRTLQRVLVIEEQQEESIEETYLSKFKQDML